MSSKWLAGVERHMPFMESYSGIWHNSNRLQVEMMECICKNRLAERMKASLFFVLLSSRLHSIPTRNFVQLLFALIFSNFSPRLPIYNVNHMYQIVLSPLTSLLLNRVCVLDGRLPTLAAIPGKLGCRESLQGSLQARIAASHWPGAVK